MRVNSQLPLLGMKRPKRNKNLYRQGEIKATLYTKTLLKPNVLTIYKFHHETSSSHKIVLQNRGNILHWTMWSPLWQTSSLTKKILVTCTEAFTAINVNILNNLALLLTIVFSSTPTGTYFSYTLEHQNILIQKICLLNNRDEVCISVKEFGQSISNNKLPTSSMWFIAQGGTWPASLLTT